MNDWKIRNICNMSSHAGWSSLLWVAMVTVGVPGCAPGVTLNFRSMPFHSKNAESLPTTQAHVDGVTEEKSPSRLFYISDRKKSPENSQGVRVVKLPEQPKLPDEVIDQVPLPDPTEELKAPPSDTSPAAPEPSAEEAKESTEPKPADEKSAETPATTENTADPAASVEPSPEPAATETDKTKPADETKSADETKPADKTVHPVAPVTSITEAAPEPTKNVVAIANTPVALTTFTSTANVSSSDENLPDQTLEIRNLSLVRQVLGYGRKIPFPRPVFQASQAVILYAEMDHFESLQTAQGYYTAMRGTVTLRDASGRVVMRQSPGLAEETCDSLRRDYYLAYILRLPSNLPSGPYTLEFRVEDCCSGHTGTATIVVQVE